MANITETSKWENQIFRLEPSTPIVGGEDGTANLQAKLLANRTRYLYDQVQEINSRGLPNQEGITVGTQRTFTKVTVNDSGIVISGGNASFQDIDGVVAEEQLPKATTDIYGIVKISNRLNLNSDDTAASSRSVMILHENKIDRSGGTFTGQTRIEVDPVEELDLVNLRSAEDIAERVVAESIDDLANSLGESMSSYLRRDGGEITGEVLAPTPQQDRQIVNKRYVDRNFIPKEGDSLVNGKISTTATTFSNSEYITLGGVKQQFYTKDQTNDQIQQNGGASLLINQASHGFQVKTVIRHDGTRWVKAKADNAETMGLLMVSKVISASSFIATQAGRVSGLTGISPGQYYFLSDTIEGDIVPTEPTKYSNAIAYGVSSTELLILPYRPIDIQGTKVVGSINNANIRPGSVGSASFSLVTDLGYIPFFPEPNNLIGVNRTPEGILYASSKNSGSSISTVSIWRLEKEIDGPYYWVKISTTPNINFVNNAPASYHLSGNRIFLFDYGFPGTRVNNLMYICDITTGNILISGSPVGTAVTCEQQSGVAESSDGTKLYIMNSDISQLAEIRISDLTLIRYLDALAPGEAGMRGDWLDGNVVVRIADNPDIILVAGGHSDGAEPIPPINSVVEINTSTGSRTISSQSPFPTMYGTGVWYNGEYFNFTGHTAHNDALGTMSVKCTKWTRSSNTWTVLPDIPRAIKYPRSFVFNNGQRDLICIMGGSVAVAGTFMPNPSIFFFDPAVNNWAEFPNQNNGWVKYPNGFIEQWGEWFPNSGDYIMNLSDADGTDVYESSVINLPITFPNACLNAVATINYGNTLNGTASVFVYNLSASQISIQYEYDNANTVLMKRSPMDSSDRMSYMWRAIGY